MLAFAVGKNCKNSLNGCQYLVISQCRPFTELCRALSPSHKADFSAIMSLPRPSLTSLFEICTLQECCHHGSFAESYDAVSTACDSLPAKTYNAMDVEAFDTRRDSYNHHHSLTQKTPSFQSLDTKTLEQREADSFDHNACISPTDFQMSIENMRPRELFPIFCLDGSTADHSICLEPSTSPADNQDAQSGTVGDAEEHQKLPDDAYCKKLSSDESRQERMELDALLLKVCLGDAPSVSLVIRLDGLVTILCFLLGRKINPRRVHPCVS